MSRPLRVLVVALSARTGGGRTHLVDQVAALADQPGLDLVVHASDELGEELRARAPTVGLVTHSRRPLPLRLLMEQVVLAWSARRFDVVYAIGNFALFACVRPQVLTIQNAWYFSASVRRFRLSRCSVPLRIRLVLESLVVRWSIKRATIVTTVSHSMGAAIEGDLGSLSHLEVVPSAAPVLPAPGRPPPGVPAEAYVLVLAHDDPHKEWDRLIAAFAHRPDLPPLVIAGRSRRDHTPARSVSVLGEVSDRASVSALYAGAACYLAHSRFESFGLTAAEALAAGVPVVASDIPAHREVCGDDARYYDVDSTEAMLRAVEDAIRGERGEQRAPARTWADNGRELAVLLRSAASGPRGPESRRVRAKRPAALRARARRGARSRRR